ncbi:MAG: cobalt-precorrin-6A reductase [Phormidesmis sp.]
MSAASQIGHQLRPQIWPQIWLIGGTSESAELAIALTQQAIPYIVTVTTEAAIELYPPDAQIQVGKLTPKTMTTFVVQQQIAGILDASHPFACEVSRQAIALAQPPHQSHIPYLRYERPTVSGDRAVTTVRSIDELLASDLLHHQRVLFTVGCRDLYRFSALRQTSQLFARILPSADAIAQATSAGFPAQNIIALRPPVSAALEKALWQQWKITRVVAKASGHASGEAIKRQVASELNAEINGELDPRLILIARPPISYPQQTNAMSAAIQFCRQCLSSSISS